MCRLLIFLPLMLAVCATHQPAGKPANYLSEPQGRVFNPISGKFEWQTPGRSPVSPGAESTSRQPYR